MLGVMRKCAWIVDAIFVPGFDFIGDGRRAFQRDSISERVNPLSSRRIGDQFIGDTANDFVASRSVPEQGAANCDNTDGNDKFPVDRSQEHSAPIKTSPTCLANGIASRIIRMRFHRARAEWCAPETRIAGREVWQ